MFQFREAHQLHVVGVLAEGYGDHGALVLAAGKMVEEAVGEIVQANCCKAARSAPVVVVDAAALVEDARHPAPGPRRGKVSTARPSTEIDPPCSGCSLAISDNDNRLDLPGPFGPTSAVNLPWHRH